MMKLFEGNNDYHGKFVFSGDIREDGKVKGGGKTCKEPVTIDRWSDHLNGKVQLGIIPINPESLCRFGAIDIDDYQLDHKALLQKIEKFKLPLVMIRSKSGGAHLYCFTQQFIRASIMQKRLREMATLLGSGSAEIFPKQVEVLRERGDVGQWLNMPYFNSEASPRHAITLQNDKVSLPDFIKLAMEKSISGENLDKFEPPLSPQFLDGPPCLQHIDTLGLKEGFRNQGMVNFAIYYKKKFPDEWKQKVEEFNSKLTKPLPPKEILILMESISKKEYNYTCRKQPICDHCNAKLCRTRKFGVGEGNGFPTLSSLTKICTEPPIWFIDVDDGGRVELTTEELQSPRHFQRRCMESLSMVPPVIDNKQWQSMLMNLMQDLHVVEIPKDNTPSGQLMQHLEDFCVNRPGDENPECLLRGQIYNYDGHHHFRMQDFLTYLDRKRFTYFKSNQITTILREYGVKSVGVNIKKGMFRSILKIKYFNPDQFRFTVPEQQTGDVPY
jgi:hypothetical protein